MEEGEKRMDGREGGRDGRRKGWEGGRDGKEEGMGMRKGWGGNAETGDVDGRRVDGIQEDRIVVTGRCDCDEGKAGS